MSKLKRDNGLSTLCHKGWLILIDSMGSLGDSIKNIINLTDMSFHASILL